MFVVQDGLFRVWGKLTLEREDANEYFGTFEPLPDFVYLKGKFEEYEKLLGSDFGNLREIGEIDRWMIQLRPKLVSSKGRELDLLSARVSSVERPSELVFYGVKFAAEDHQDY